MATQNIPFYVDRDDHSLASEVIGDLRGFLDKSRGANVPWADARVFDTKIRRNIKLAECPSFGKSIFRYAPNCPGATDYAALANEVIGEVVMEPTEGKRLVIEEPASAAA